MQETQNRILEHDLTDLPTRIRVLGEDGFYPRLAGQEQYTLDQRTEDVPPTKKVTM